MLKFGNVTMIYERGEWTLEIITKASSHLAKSDHKVITEYHGILHRALPAVRRYLTDEDDIKRYETFVQMLVLSCKLFKEAGSYPFTQKMEYRIPCLAGEHHVRTNKNHGCVRLTQSVLTAHFLSSDGTTRLVNDPGNHRQACDIILSTDIGEKLSQVPDIGFEKLMAYTEERIRLTFDTLKNASPAVYGSGDDDQEESSDAEQELASAV